jgi:hypothetical protein
MKRKIGFAAGFVLIAWSLSSCEGLFQSCKVCKQVTYVSGNITQTGTEADYCGADLIKVQAIPDATVGSTTVKWECN